MPEPREDGSVILRALGVSVLILSVAMAAAGFAFTRFYTTYTAVPDCMEPTVYKDERLLVDLRAYRNNIPQRGDLVLFRCPQDKKLLVGRVAAFPSESVELRQHVLLVDKNPVSGRWVKRYYNRGDFGQPKKPVTVPPETFYVLGDYTARSFDSRFWGFLPAENIVGKPLEVLYPLKRRRPLQ